MDIRRGLTSIGAGVTSFFLVTVLIIELLDFEFSAIIGLPVGLLTGIMVFVGLWIHVNELRLGIRRIVTAYAAFGLSLLVFLALRYVNLGRSLLTVEVIVGGSLAAVVIVYFALFVHDRGRSK